MKIAYRRLLPGENTRLLAIATFIGLTSGLLIILFRSIVSLFHNYFVTEGSIWLGIDQGGWHLLLLPLIPMAGMVLLAPLSLLFPGYINGYGFPSFLHKVNIEGGHLKGRTIILKILATALTIGTGNSAGVEGPIAQINGAMGSQVGRFFKVSGSRMKVYIAAGCAGGIAGMFNAPIAGIFFAAEIVLLGTFEISSFAALVTASAMATVVTRAYYGEVSVFVIPKYAIVNHFVELPLYGLLAVIVGILAVVYIKTFYLIRDRYRLLPIHPLLKPISGALLVGLIAIFFPQVMGDGYAYMDRVLSSRGLLVTMAALIFLKIIATSITLGAGGAGGVFAPTLFIGAMIGGTFGKIVNLIAPDHTAAPGAYAAVGIGAFLAAATHAPMTAIFLLFEMTGNYRIIVPAMLSSIIATIVATRFCKDSIDTVDFSRAGIDISEGRETAIMKSILVGAAISEDVDFVSESANINQLLELFSAGKGGFYFPVVNDAGTMTGIVSLSDVKTVLHQNQQQRASQKVGTICNRRVIALTPNDTLYAAMQLFDSQGYEEIPVVESQQDRWVVGMLKRRDAIALYNRQVVKKGISEKMSATHIIGSS